MPVTLCHTCMAIHTWSWEEAFDKFGFNDGDGLVMTNRVVQVLRDALRAPGHCDQLFRLIATRRTD